MECNPSPEGLAPFWPERIAALWPKRVAVVDVDRETEYTFESLDHRSRSVAGGLQRLGVGRGDRVAVLDHNSVRMLDLLYACAALGAVFVPLNWRLSRRELADLILDMEPSVVFAGTEFLETAHAMVSAIQIIESSEAAASYRELLLSPPAQPATVSMTDPWLILYTGGTTGAPKGAVLTHGSITWNSINTCVSWGLSHDDVGPVFTPAFHTGFWNVFTLPLLLVGGRVLIAERFDPAQALSVIITKRPSILFLVPTMFQQLAETPGFDSADMSSLRWAISGGAPLPQPVSDRWQPKVREFKQGYGLTEVGPNNFATPDGTIGKPGTVGRLTAFAQARIVDDNGADVEDGTAGELLLAGPHMCAGYWRRPEATEEAIRNGWFATGDMARRDNDGFYFIVDRKKDMIITGGENVYPIEVETVLYGHECVREVAVVGVPDAVWGEAVTAVVSFKPGHIVTTDALKEFARQRLARYKVPKDFVLVDDVPKTGANKLSRVEARKLALSIIAVDADADHRPVAIPMIPSRGEPK